MNKHELKQKIQTLSKELEKETNPEAREAKKKNLQRHVETYATMLVPQNRMMVSNGK